MQLAEDLVLPPGQKPIEDVLPLEKRDAVRRDWLAQVRWYNPWLHLGVTSVFGLAAIAAAITQIHSLKWWQVLFGVSLFVLANAAEWRIHKSLLHQRVKGATLLYDRHTPLHHMVFVTDDMSLRNTGEFRLVLLPAFAIVALFFGLAPITAAIWFGWPVPVTSVIDQHNLAAVFTVVTMGYVVSYEWLHLSYHLPPDSFVGRLPGMGVLRRHHSLHHDPRLMQKWNFNVSLPLWDLVRRTYVRRPV